MWTFSQSFMQLELRYCGHDERAAFICLQPLLQHVIITKQNRSV